MRRLCILLLGVLAASLAGTPMRLAAQGIGPDIGTTISFNGGDFQWGGQAGIAIAKLDLSVRADFTARAGAKRVIVPSGLAPDLYFQYRETRYFIGGEIEKRFKVLEPSSSLALGGAGSVAAGYTWGDYKGTGVLPYRGLGYRARISPYILIENSIEILLGYEYNPSRTEDVSDHRIMLGFHFIFIP